MQDFMDPFETEEPVEILLADDGSATIVLEEEPPIPEFSDNLAEFMDESDLSALSDDLMESFEQFLTERKEWEDTFKEGLEILGIKLETIDHPFPGACAAHSPIMLEAALQFQANAITELFPAGGPIKTAVVGAQDSNTVAQANRVKDYMNYQVTEEMEEYYDELDTLLFHLPLGGSAFKKTYYDPTLARPVSKFVSAEQMVVPYGASDLRTCSRYAQVIPTEKNDLKKMQVVGFYRDVDLSDPVAEPKNDVQTTKDDISGQEELETSSYQLIEFCADLDLVGFEDLDPVTGEPRGLAVPYVVTLDKGSGKILSIRRNWEDGDSLSRKMIWHTHYKFLPGLGFYGLGLVHILGNLQKTATATLRALIDAGQFANMPSGFKARGMRIEGGDKPLAFGEFRDVEGYGDDIRNSIIPLPVKEPSQTLFLLLGKVIEDARRLAAVSDMNASDMNKEAPVGTTLAVMEQGKKVMSAIHKRLHRAQRNEFKILARINGSITLCNESTKLRFPTLDSLNHRRIAKHHSHGNHYITIRRHAKNSYTMKGIRSSITRTLQDYQ